MRVLLRHHPEPNLPVSLDFMYPFVSLRCMSLALKSWVKVEVWQSTVDSFCLKQCDCMWSHKDNM